MTLELTESDRRLLSAVLAREIEYGLARLPREIGKVRRDIDALIGEVEYALYREWTNRFPPKDCESDSDGSGEAVET